MLYSQCLLLLLFFYHPPLYPPTGLVTQPHKQSFFLIVNHRSTMVSSDTLAHNALPQPPPPNSDIWLVGKQREINHQWDAISVCFARGINCSFSFVTVTFYDTIPVYIRIGIQRQHC